MLYWKGIFNLERKIKFAQEKNVKWLFFIGIIIYTIWISLFTSTVHIDVDEELYVTLAKSFHYLGRFEKNGQLLDYSCVFYSMLLSLAYYFYTPESILFLMRFIGVICMCSSVFPIYLLSKDILMDENMAVRITALFLIMPYMADCAYMMQEVLCYPLFCWLLFFVYHFFEQVGSRTGYKWCILAAIFSAILFFVKTYTFFIPITLNLSLLTMWMRAEGEKKKRVIWSVLIYDILYMFLLVAFYFMIFAINGFEKGVNHYSSQIMNLFPITSATVFWGIIGCLVYLCYLVFNTGIFTIGSLIVAYKKERKGFFLWVIGSLLFMIVEIVFMIVLTEEGVGVFPHKILFRYFQIWVPVLLIVFVKWIMEKDTIYYRFIFWTGVVGLVGCLIYYLFRGTKARQAIMDGHLYLILENVSKIIVPYADVAIMVVIIAFLLVMYSKKTYFPKEKVLMGMGGVIVGLWIITMLQLPIYTNIYVKGTEVEKEGIEIAKYAQSNKIDEIFYIYDTIESRDGYLRSYYGYTKQDCRTISVKDYEYNKENSMSERVILLIPEYVTAEIDAEPCRELVLSHFTVYLPK